MLKYLNVFPETKAVVQRYKPEDRCFLYEAMMDYAFTGEEPSWQADDAKWFIWEALKQAVDRADMVRESKQRAGRASAEQREAESNTRQQNATKSNTTQHSATEGNSESESESESDTESEKYTLAHSRKNRAREPELFDQFWNAYPRKIAKQGAIKAFAKLKADEELLQTILDALERQKMSPQWQRDNGQFIPYAATWLNGHRWEDEVVKDKADQLWDEIEGGKYSDTAGNGGVDCLDW